MFLNNSRRLSTVAFSFFLPFDSLIGVWAACLLKFRDDADTEIVGMTPLDEGSARR